MLSILIVNWNTRELLRACLGSIFAFPPQDEFEVIVVDNASKDDGAAMVEAEFPAVRLVRSDRNEGYAKGNNMAFELARGDWLLTLNPDTEVFEGTLDRAIEALSANPDSGALGARLVLPDGSTQRSVRGFPSVLGVVGEALGLTRFGAFGNYALPDFDYESEGPAPQPMGTFLLFRRSALEAIGDPKRPFDEAFPIFFNEVDLLERMAQAGWPCLYSPDVRVLHHHGQSTRQVRKAMIWESHRSLVRYLRKHSGPAQRWLVLPCFAAVAYVAAFVRARGYYAGFRP